MFNAAAETPIGFVPTPSSLTLDGMSISPEAMDELLRVEPSDWVAEEEATGKFFEKFGSRLPQEIRKEQAALAERLQRSTVATK